MFIKERIEGNKVNSPILFIGVGGIGCKIIKGVADRTVKDDTRNIRFVAMDTDVNELMSVNKNAEIISIQTSSTSTVGSYLANDHDARKHWFPGNKMLEEKNVSEGAGQIRAISRLAINDIIKNGRISKLYGAIDDLFLKDGGSMKQTVRVVIASTVACGTGSGIAMEVGMLVRHYIQNNYPEAAVMVRGFLVMPGVMDTVITSQSERDSQRCNGYATIKEINAFMMKGSGFFDSVPELQRYKDLAITVPNSSTGEEKISTLPFDFCFLMDRTDYNAGNMTTLPQYIDYAAQSVYEQNIGPMGRKASSKEDNVLKLCLDPDRMGRCRFGGIGSSVLRYPYEDIRTYIALNWARASVIGSSADDRMSEEDRKELLENSWLQYDMKFKEEHKAWEENPNASSKNEPNLAQVYISKMDSGADQKNGNDFTMMLWDKYLTPKIDTLGERAKERTIDAVVKKYISSLVEGAFDGPIDRELSLENTLRQAKKPAETNQYRTRYTSISTIETKSKDSRVIDIARGFAKETFSSKAAANKEDLGEYMLEKFMAVNGKIVHPNVARYLLYKLQKGLEAGIKSADQAIGSFENSKSLIINGVEAVSDALEQMENAAKSKKDKEKDADTDQFSVFLHFGKEKNLSAMCEACDAIKSFDDKFGNPGERCNEILDNYSDLTIGYFKMLIQREICEIALTAVGNLIKSYENFFASFENKIPNIEKQKEDIVTKLAFRNGDYVYHVLGEKKYLDMLVANVGRPSETGKEASQLYAKIFESLRNNAYIDARRNNNPFYYESKKDIFQDIVIEYYKDRVDDSCDIIHVKNILEAVKLEHDVDASLELQKTTEALKDEKAAELYKEGHLVKYITSVLEKCKNLASPSIKKKDNEEPREVDAIACNDAIADGGGIRVGEYLPDAIKTPTVSKYELHFFRSIYNVMPTQLSKLSAPVYDDDTDEFTLSSQNEYEQLSAGDYFRVYQRYMDKIGPDSKTSAVITPHVDKRWNSISVMPELDLEYQKRLMRKIHKAMLYGFVYGRIRLYKTSEDNPDEKVYKYLDVENETRDLVVSNLTKCDVLYEVLDALYFDRFAVATLRDYVNQLRIKNSSAGFQSIEDIEFFKLLKELKFSTFNSCPKTNAIEERISLFTAVMMYCNSLPVQNKDMAEMKTMVDAIIEMFYNEMQICVANKDSLLIKVADLLVDQFNCLVDNYTKHRDILYCGIFSEQALSSIYRSITRFLKKKDLEKYIEKLAKPEEI